MQRMRRMRRMLLFDVKVEGFLTGAGISAGGTEHGGWMLLDPSGGCSSWLVSGRKRRILPHSFNSAVRKPVTILAVFINVVGVVDHIGKLFGRSADGPLPHCGCGIGGCNCCWIVLPLLQLGRILFVKSMGQRLEALQRVVTVGGVDLVEINSGTLHLGVSAEGQLPQTLQLHDVHLAAEVFGQVTVDPEGDHAVGAFERPRVLRRRRPERQIHIHLVEVGDGSFVFLEVALCPEGNGACVAAEGPLEVVDVDVEAELRRFGKYLAANAAGGFAVIRQFESSRSGVGSETGSAGRYDEFRTASSGERLAEDGHWSGAAGSGRRIHFADDVGADDEIRQNGRWRFLENGASGRKRFFELLSFHETLLQCLLRQVGL